MRAAAAGHKMCASRLLFQAGAQSATGKTALMLACQEGHFQLVPLLKTECGLRDNDNQTALMHAVKSVGEINSEQKIVAL